MAQTPLEGTWEAIRSMSVRGATRISMAAANALAAQVATLPSADWKTATRAAAARLASARPSAVSLENGIAAVAGPALAAADLPAAVQAAQAAAKRWSDALQAGRVTIAKAGAALLPKGATVLTHCHSATAVAVLAEGHRTGRVNEVLATETRPWRQGLTTVRELAAAGVPVTLIVDSAAGHFVRSGAVAAVVVGADTVCRDATLINKIGTSSVALCGHEAGIPVLCATSSCKFTHRQAAQVGLEERDPAEVAAAGDLPRGVRVLNPVFDRTPAKWVTTFVTEHGAHGPREAVALALRDLPAKVPW